jgi:hypothetical protein
MNKRAMPKPHRKNNQQGLGENLRGNRERKTNMQTLLLRLNANLANEVNERP